MRGNQRLYGIFVRKKCTHQAVNIQYRHVSTARKLCFHVHHFSCLCSVFLHVSRGTYAPAKVGQIIIIIHIVAEFPEVYTWGQFGSLQACLAKKQSVLLNTICGAKMTPGYENPAMGYGLLLGCID